MTNTLKTAVLAHAENLELKLDAQFIRAVQGGIKNMGVLNPKIPNSFVRASPKTLSPKFNPNTPLAGISAFSVPVVQKYDWAGGAAVFFRAFRFLLTPFFFDIKRKTIIDDALTDGPASQILSEILGPDWRQCVAEIKGHLNRAIQSPFVDSGEKQIFWKTEKDYLIVSPLADTLAIELKSRINARSKVNQFFGELDYQVGGDKFQNSGVMATTLGGRLPKLMAFPPDFHREPSPMLSEPEPGQFLALEFDTVGTNVTGGGIAGGLANVTTALGFADALRRLLLNVGVDISPQSIAFGFSRVKFHGEYQKGKWTYSMKKGYREAAQGKVFPQPVAELTANARVHIVLQLEKIADPEILNHLSDILARLRFGGGPIFNSISTLQADPEVIFDDWGKRVWFVADRQYEIEDEPDRLDAVLDCLKINKKGNSWEKENPTYGLASTGYQGIEPPRPRDGLRDSSCRHIYAASTAGLMEWVRAEECASDAVFWSAKWDRVNYTCAAVAKRFFEY